MIISIGNDHAGPAYKKAIVAYLQKLGHTVLNNGTVTNDSVDYPDFGHAVALDVTSGKAELGIVICGSGNGIAITANKHQNIRCALCWTPEIAELARQHNSNSNGRPIYKNQIRRRTSCKPSKQNSLYIT